MSRGVVEWLFLAVPWGCLQFMIVVFPDHTHLLFWNVDFPCYTAVHSLVVFPLLVDGLWFIMVL